MNSGQPSPASAASTSASSAPECAAPCKPSPTSGAEPCSPPDSPASPASPTSATWRKARKAMEPDGLERWEATALTGTLTDHGLGLPADVLVGSTCSVEGSPAKTFPSPGSEPVSPASARGSSTNSPESLQLFDPPGCSLRTYPDCSPRTAVGTSGSSLASWPKSGTARVARARFTLFSESPNGAVESSLSAILEATTDPRYELSVKAAAGVLRRAKRRGRRLPLGLETALKRTAAPPVTTSRMGGTAP